MQYVSVKFSFQLGTSISRHNGFDDRFSVHFWDKRAVNYKRFSVMFSSPFRELTYYYYY